MAGPQRLARSSRLLEGAASSRKWPSLFFATRVTHGVSFSVLYHSLLCLSFTVFLRCYISDFVIASEPQSTWYSFCCFFIHCFHAVLVVISAYFLGQPVFASHSLWLGPLSGPLLICLVSVFLSWTVSAEALSVSFSSASRLRLPISFRFRPTPCHVTICTAPV